jgi:hypothetical protein
MIISFIKSSTFFSVTKKATKAKLKSFFENFLFGILRTRETGT